MSQNPKPGSRRQEQQCHKEGRILSMTATQKPGWGRGANKQFQVEREGWGRRPRAKHTISQISNESSKNIRKTSHSRPHMCDSANGWEP